MKLYGIPNCGSVKKARAWLAQHGIACPFHDFRKDGVEESLLRRWLDAVPWETLVNRRGTTWRQLPDPVKQGVRDPASALALMLAQPSVIKRPVLEVDGRVVVGFDEETYAQIFRQKAP
jgi:arsenate reductase